MSKVPENFRVLEFLKLLPFYNQVPDVIVFFFMIDCFKGEIYHRDRSQTHKMRRKGPFFWIIIDF
jgi:hypothetical protein